MKVLIVGAGIAGPALAYWLERYGIEPTIVEKAPLIQAKQKSAFRYMSIFAPKTLLFRNQMMNLLRIPWLAEFAFARDLKDDLTLPEY